MESCFYILIKKQNSFPVGTIFEKLETKLVSLDDSKNLQQNESILTFCEIIDKKSVLLIQPLSAENRIKFIQDPSWIFLSSLDVGETCWYLMNNKEVPCQVMSKNLTKIGMMFSINLEGGFKIETTIDRLKYKKLNSETTEINAINKLDIQEKMKNLITSFEDMSQQKDRSRRRETIAFGISKNITPKCNCFKEIFKKADDLRLSTLEKQNFLKNLLRILPKEMFGDDGRCSLHWASHYLLLESVTELIMVEDFKNRRDTMGNTPLHLAISSPYIDPTNVVIKKNLESILQLFFLNKIDLNIKNKNEDTVLTKIIKNADFNLFEFVLKNIDSTIVLSNHLLANKTSILEFLIKVEKYHLANIYCAKLLVNHKENQLLLQAAFHAIYRNYNNLAQKITEKCTDIDFILSDGETLLTKILKENLINSASICYQLDNVGFDVSKQNDEKEYPLLLACGRLLLDPVKLILNKGNISVSQLNECLNEVITIYTNLYIDNNYKKTKTEFINRKFETELPGPQLKIVVVEIVDLLIKKGATTNSSTELQQLVDECVDQEFGKIVKHLYRQQSGSLRRPITKLQPENKNECSICMDRNIDCSFACGHTYCSMCADQLNDCPSCRIPLTGKRNIYIS